MVYSTQNIFSKFGDIKLEWYQLFSNGNLVIFCKRAYHIISNMDLNGFHIQVEMGFDHGKWRPNHQQ